MTCFPQAYNLLLLSLREAYRKMKFRKLAVGPSIILKWISKI